MGLVIGPAHTVEGLDGEADERHRDVRRLRHRAQRGQQRHDRLDGASVQQLRRAVAALGDARELTHGLQLLLTTGGRRAESLDRLCRCRQVAHLRTRLHGPLELGCELHCFLVGRLKLHQLAHVLECLLEVAGGLSGERATVVCFAVPRLQRKRRCAVILALLRLRELEVHERPVAEQRSGLGVLALGVEVKRGRVGFARLGNATRL
mmetsp:Transcript_24344/g.62181  ORF Transcript_24344/g.62181 Transcript_24344/m.62181 type:complete len:207 (+) Transcript_24344:2514-3134(+)